MTENKLMLSDTNYIIPIDENLRLYGEIICGISQVAALTTALKQTETCYSILRSKQHAREPLSRAAAGAVLCRLS
jgi:hypothetical protein